MKNSEQAIQRVLEGLRDVDTPAGMEGRILLAMQRRATEPSPARWQRMWKVVPSRAAVAGGVGLAGLVGAMLFCIPQLHQSAPRPMAGQLTAVHPIPKQTLEAAMQLRVTRSPLQKAKVLSTIAGSESDALALDEMRAPSQQAPPLPLTEQERLLLRVAQKGDQEQLAMLNPEMRSRQELQAKLEFQNFFEPDRSTEENPKKTIHEKGDTQ